jgi:ABC-type transport system involved in Fe-S cluster assembly fused permease/ATPase subunit
MYAILTFANSESCIGWLQFWLWRPLEQYATQALNTAAHAHVMGLSSDFHDSKESADINQAVHQGHSVTELVELICFEILPILIDLVAVCFYLNFLFGPYMGLILAFTSTTFLYTTTKLVVLTRVRRRKFIKNYRKEWISAYTTLNNWRTATVS